MAAKQQSGFDPRQKAFSVLDEFKAFAFKGNVIDLAVGVVIGAAFAKIIDSLVKHIIMPVIALAMPSDQSYTEWKWVVNGKEVPYGLFLGEILNFLIVALALFLIVVKVLGWLMRARKKQAAAEAEAVEKLTRDQELLTEIRDLLKTQKS